MDEDDPWSGILSSEALSINSTANGLKGYSTFQLIFGYDIILPIKYTVDWELVRQKNQTQNNKDNIRENSKRVDHNYKVGDKVTLDNNSAFKYKTPYNRPFEIKQRFTNSTVTIQYDETKIRHNICHINTYKSDTNVEDIKC